VSNCSPSSQTDHDKPDDSGNPNDFLNEFSSNFESNKKSLTVNTNEDIGPASNLLERPDNGKSDDQCHRNETVNEVSKKPDNDQKPMASAKQDDIAICSDKEFSLDNVEWNCDGGNCGRI
jgi:hypothetical protein